MNQKQFDDIAKTHDHFIFVGYDKEKKTITSAMHGRTSELCANIQLCIEAVCEKHGELTPLQFAQIMTKIFNEQYWGDVTRPYNFVDVEEAIAKAKKILGLPETP